MVMEIIERGLQNSLKETLPAALKAITSPAVAELAQRGTAENPTIYNEAMQRGIPSAQRAMNEPFHGDPSLREFVRATKAVASMTIPEGIQAIKTTLGAFFRKDPNLASDVQEKLYNGTWRTDRAKELANAEMKKIYEPILSLPTNDKPYLTAVMHDYEVASDYVSQAETDGIPTIGGKPVTEWQTFKDQLEPRIAHPAVVATRANRRAAFDGMFADMVNRGWQIPEHYREEYTPMRKLYAMAEGLANQGGEDYRDRLLSAQMHRGTDLANKRETNLILLEHQVMTDYYRKAAEHDAFTELMSDKTLEFSDKFADGDMTPHGLVAYNPDHGDLGYQAKADDREAVETIGREMRKIYGISNIVTPGSYVIPSDLANAFRRYSASKSHPVEKAMTKGVRSVARWMTVYNPRNLFLNFGSDMPLAMFGMPGEKAHPVGVLRFYAGIGKPNALAKSAQLVFGKSPVHATINGQVVDLRALVENSGLQESTMIHQLQGQQIAEELARLIPESQKPGQYVVGDVLQKLRQTAELAPRMAAGLREFEATGNINDFGRVGRQITLPYGSGAPSASKIPIVRIMSPFIQFFGLASSRVFDLMTTKGSRGRTLAATIAVPYVCYLWNSRNTDYQEAEQSLAPTVRDQTHLWVPDPKDPTKVLRDVHGKRVAIPFRMSVIEDVMRTFGAGNLASRAGRVIEGRDKWTKIITDTGKNAISNLSQTATMVPGLMTDLATNQQASAFDRIMKLAPGTRPIIKGIETGADFGPKAGAIAAGQELVGASTMPVARKGSAALDVDLMEAKGNLAKAEQAYKRAIYNHEGDSKVRDARKKLDDAATELKRIAPVLKEEHAEWRNSK